MADMFWVQAVPENGGETPLQLPCFQQLLYLEQIPALGGVQAAHFVIGGGKVRHHHGDKAAPGTGPHAVVAVLQHQRFSRDGAQRLGGCEEVSGSGLDAENCSPEIRALK